MPTQTRHEDNKKTNDSSQENHEPIQRSKLPILIKRNALVEISNINYKSLNIHNSIKFNSVLSKRITLTEKDEVNRITKDAVLIGGCKKEKKCLEKVDKDEMKNIKDIDELYKCNIFLISEYAESIYDYLRNLEIKHKIKRWPLNVCITAQMRAILFDWLVQIHLEYDLLQETLHLAVQLIDRFIQISTCVTVKNLQLIGVCCLFIAAKYEEILPLSGSDFLYLCNDTYGKDEFNKMERTILFALDFQIIRPYSICFLRRYSLVAKAERQQHIYAKYLLDLAIIESSFCHIRPSLLAAIAFFISICIINNDFNPSYWTEQLIFYSKYKYEHLKPFIGKLCKLLLYSNGKYFKTIKKKYSVKEFEFVSSKILFNINLLKKLCEIKPRD